MQEEPVKSRFQIEQHGHGGDVWTASERLGVSREQLVDFSANINPLGPPASVWRAIQCGLSSVVAYPDPACRELKRVLVERLGGPISTAHVLVGNGAAEVLYGIFTALSPRRVGLVQPCFSEYAEAARVVGAEVVALVARVEEDFLPPLGELLELCRGVDVMVVGYPNNPNGRLLPFDWLVEMARVSAEHGGHLVVDEAFLDFLPRARSLLERLAEMPQVVLLRSMTKFYSIPGLRLGYAVATPELIRQVERVLPPWRVNAMAQVAGVAGLQDVEFAEQTWAWLEEERAYLVEGLQKLSRVRVFAGQVNFVLFYCEGVQKGSVNRGALDLQAELGQRGILIRSCAEYPGLGPSYYRVAVRARRENEWLLRELGNVLAT